ncbi:RlpA-like protein, double-psi beta-barrel domain [Dillenia turbinata]|uniref:RlpA-like protein, double-psi beta-barrel domain n=1 Tax=Dillenia turbinata TaxID=194707 RepID=A0AAN8UWB0_9MAGN
MVHVVFNQGYFLYCLVTLYSFSSYTHAWAPAGATWYGSPTGFGSEGGACGYGGAVGQPPFSSMISAGGPSLYKGGQGCGVCYQVRCGSNAACSGNPVTVVITDECPGCVAEPVHFDLSGTAFGAMAKPGQADQLRNAGNVQIEYQRQVEIDLVRDLQQVQCNYPGVTIVFTVDPGSTKNYFVTLIEFEDGDGDLGKVDLLVGGAWLPLQRSHGAVWMINSGTELSGAFSIRLTTLASGKTLVANNVIPADWLPGHSYRSSVNFN